MKMKRFLTGLLSVLIVFESLNFTALAEDLVIEEPFQDAASESYEEEGTASGEELVPDEASALIVEEVPEEAGMPVEEDAAALQDSSQEEETSVDSNSIEVVDIQDVDLAQQDSTEALEFASFHNILRRLIPVDTSLFPENDMLYEEYVDQVFDAWGVQTYANNGRKYLSGFELDIYERLREAIEEIAAGEMDTSEIFLGDMDDYFVWSFEELDLDLDAGQEEIEEAAENAFDNELDFAEILNYLLVDCPYDFYWYDKSNENLLMEFEIYGEADIDMIWIKSLTLSFPVAEDYQGGDIYELNSQKTSAANRAAQNAQAIAKEYADETLEKKLTSYKNKICALVSYDDAAEGYGDSYQMVNVFDEDPDTNVVSEGYAKAFQYLCDLDSGGATCYLAQGTISLWMDDQQIFSDTEHMWNLVRYDGCTYLADVTNSDKGAIGSEGELFLTKDYYQTGTDESGYPYYTFLIESGEGQNYYLTYRYDSLETGSIYPLSVLTLGNGDRVSIEDCEISLSEEEIVYTGSEIEPAVTVIYEEEHATLEEGVDYTVSYENNIDVGPASAIVTGIGNYTGEKTLDFSIIELPIDFPYFWDDNFIAYIKENFDDDGNDSLSPEEIAAVEEINVQGGARKDEEGNSIIYTSMKGIQYFTSLRILTCGSNVLTELDVSGMASLEELYCSQNYYKGEDDDPVYTLESLDVSGCTSLKSLNCEKNALTWLYLSDCEQLETLYCGYNMLDELDLENNPNIRQLQCFSNQLERLDVSGMSALYELQCWQNNLTSLNVSGNTALITLRCEQNQLTSLDVTNLTSLRTLICGSNYFTTLDVSKNTELRLLDCSICIDGQMLSLDISNNLKLTELDCSNLLLKELITAEEYPDLSTFSCNSNQLTSLDLSIFPELQTLSCKDCMLTSLDISCLEDIESVNCSENNLTSLILGECEELGYLDCSFNHLTSLDLSGLKWLGVLVCSNNELMELDLSHNRYLTGIDCSGNHLTELDLSNCNEMFGIIDEHISDQRRDVTAFVSDGTAAIDLTELVRLDHIGNILPATSGAELADDKILIRDLSENAIVYEYTVEAGDITGVMEVTLDYVVDISGADITLSETVFTYDGSQKMPEITVAIGDTILEEGVDYRISYTDNINAGTAGVEITGRGKYINSCSESFTIDKAEQNVTAVLADDIIEVGSKTVIKESGIGAISYESDDPSVATVDENGFITGVKAGTATITVTAEGDDNHNAGSVSVTITVKQAQPETETESESESETVPGTEPADDDPEAPEKFVDTDEDGDFNDSEGKVSVEQELTYMITYYNHHALTEEIIITDVLDEGLEYIESSDNGSYDPKTRTITWSVTTDAKSEGFVTVKAKVLSEAEKNGEIINSAAVRIGSDGVKETREVRNPLTDSSGTSTSGTVNDGTSVDGSSGTTSSVKTADETPIAPTVVLLAAAIAVFLGTGAAYKRRRVRDKV